MLSLPFSFAQLQVLSMITSKMSAMVFMSALVNQGIEKKLNFSSRAPEVL